MKKSLQKKALSSALDNESDAEKEERERLVAAWIAGAEAKPKTAQYEENFWANERMNDLACGRSDDAQNAEEAEEAWKVILAILERPLSDHAIAYLAAGPLEDLLGYHGEAFIERVETEARRDAVFRKTLNGVWQNGMSEAIWKRAQTAMAREATLPPKPAAGRAEPPRGANRRAGRTSRAT